MLNMKTKKGITPIISIIILLGITVALAGLAWSVLSGYLGGYTEKVFEIPFNGGVYCLENGASNWTVRVFVRNVGTTALVGSDFSLVEIDGSTVSTVLGASGTISAGSAGFLIDNNCGGGGGCSVGAHTIDIATESGTIKHEVVYCG